jgi:HD-like signal output (HDOD) protein
MTVEAHALTGSCAFKNLAERDAQALVLTLRTDRVSGDTDLPCFPNSAVQLQQLLAEPDVDVTQIAKAITFHPVLTGRVLLFANSAALNSTGPRINDLKTAVSRIGADAVRTAVIAHGLHQITRTADNSDVRVRLEKLWDRSAWMAAMSYVLAKRCPAINRNHAMLAGLLHGVGKLYVITRAARHPFVLQDRELYLAIEREWQGPFAKAVLTAWRIGPEIVAAIGNFDNLTRDRSEEAELADVLTVAYLLIGYVGRYEALAPTVGKIKSFSHLNFAYETLGAAVNEAQEEVDSIRYGLECA